MSYVSESKETLRETIDLNDSEQVYTKYSMWRKINETRPRSLAGAWPS